MLATSKNFYLLFRDRRARVWKYIETQGHRFDSYWILVLFFWATCVTDWKIIFLSGGSRGGARGTRPSLAFRPNWGPKGRKKLLKTAPPLILGSGWPPPPSVSQGLHPALFLMYSPGPGCLNVGYYYPPDKSLPSGKVLGKPVELSIG